MVPRPHLRRAAAVAAALLATACGAADIAQPVTETGPPPTTMSDGPTEGDDVTYPAGLQRLVDLAVTDLATRLDRDPGDVEVVAAELVTWPDAALGCPQPDMRYAQVPQDGARIELRVAARRYRYHSGGSRTTPFLCEPRRSATDQVAPRLDR